jgi:hypothetical protein
MSFPTQRALTASGEQKWIEAAPGLPDTLCPPGTLAAHLHVHPPLENPYPTDPADYDNANGHVGIPYYLGAPIPNSPVFPAAQKWIVKYWNGGGKTASENLCVRYPTGWSPFFTGGICVTPTP